MLAFTSRVRPAPNLPVRNLVPLPLPPGVAKGGPNSRFTVLSYNMLADLYAKVCMQQTDVEAAEMLLRMLAAQIQDQQRKHLLHLEAVAICCNT